MASPPIREELAGNPTNAEFKLGIGKLWDYVTSLLGNSAATIANNTEKKLARESLGIGSFGFKNRLINPEFSINQEFGIGALVPIVAGSGIKYIADQWYAQCGGANISAQHIAGIIESQYSLRLTGANSNTSFMLGQRIESNNCADLKNKNITVSLNSKSTSARTISWTAFYANFADVFSSKTTIASGTIDITTSVESYQFTFNAGSNANNGIAIEFSGGALLAGSTIDFDAIQLEASLIATEFEKRNAHFENILAMRYYEVIAGTIVTTTTLYLNRYFKVTKRSSPTLALKTGGLAGSNFDAGPEPTTSFRAPAGVTPTTAGDFVVSANARL